MASKGIQLHRMKGATSSTKQTTDTVVQHVAIARYDGSALMASIARPKSDSALDTRTLTLAAFPFASATTPLPQRSCQTVASPMPPVRRGTNRSAVASGATMGTAEPTVVATAVGNSNWSLGTPRTAEEATDAPKRPRLVAASSMMSWAHSPCPDTLPALPPKFVTVTLRLTPSDWDTMPSSAATKWTLRRLSLFSILKSHWAPTGNAKRFSLIRSVKLSFRKTSEYRRSSSRVVEERASCFLIFLLPRR
mmetsp:Transcript_38522/g.89341  ORF Transcript_38522/g.89341 Transcript_38522/m.89341 type:complete len:250 (-) Transcript_38522:413-1162(-)